MITASTVRNEAFESWLSQVNQACGRFDARALDTDFYGELTEFRSGAINLSVVDMAHVHLYRTSKDVSTSSDGHYYAVFQLRGSSQLEQGGNRAQLGCGDIALIDASRPSDMIYHDDCRQLSLILPRQVVERGSHFNAVNCATRIAAGSPLAAMANKLVLDTRQQEGLEMQESEAVLDALASLLLPGISARDCGADAHERQFRKIIAFIDAHLSDEELCPELIAREVGISVRGLYRMFSKRGLVVAQYIKHRRLDFCAENLRRADVEQKLSALCYAWGFSDSSYFSSAFKSRFGVSPGAYRKRYSQI
ncbi:Transcriptional activator FeaR [Pseudomonas fluorescens]|uniref:Transcriptional activator FeaR n=1 Tax=Pseudomonas fluorescens TaxID=294 RepID=A0A5E7V611_PSEFL|nr:transcriptional regulator FeaR [Pseudomonas fluorescens]VVQ19417.1 Transcriptional activator FeaR [Pseudomonas fluorescens]